MIDKVQTLPLPTTQILNYTDNTTLFQQSVRNGNLTQLVDFTPNITIFVPIDSVLQRYNSTIQNGSISDLTSWVTPYIVNQSLSTDQLANLTSVITINGTFNVYVNKTTSNASTIAIDNAMIILGDIITQNGILHIINNVFNLTQPHNYTSSYTKFKHYLFNIHRRPLGLLSNVFESMYDQLGGSGYIDMLGSNPNMSPGYLAGGACINQQAIHNIYHVIQPYNASNNSTLHINSTSLNSTQASNSTTSNQTIIIPPVSQNSSAITGCDNGLSICYIAELDSTCNVSNTLINQSLNNNGTANFTYTLDLYPQCYNSSNYVCTSNFLCPVYAPLLCGRSCYSANDYVCYTTFSLCPAAHPLGMYSYINTFLCYV